MALAPPLRGKSRGLALRRRKSPAAKSRLSLEILEARSLLTIGYVPLAPTTNMVWTTGYYAISSTVDLQGGAALAPDVANGEAAALPRAVSVNANGLPLLESRANGQGLSLFVDFARNSDGFGPFSIDTDRNNFNLAEQTAIYNTWRNLTGYFSAFDVNVTTVRPNVGASDPSFAWIQVTNEVTRGYAYLNSLTKSGPTGFNAAEDTTYRYTGIAHEFGHILGLDHQSNYTSEGVIYEDEYSHGDGYRNIPTMGYDFEGAPTSRFWYGRTAGGQNSKGSVIQDDLAVVTRTIRSQAGGDGYRPDDFGNTVATATAVASGSQFDAFIERMTDVDVYRINPTTAGNWNITATPQFGSHLQPKLELLDAAGNIIASRDDAAYRNGPTNEQYLNIALQPGVYYVRVSSSGGYDQLGYYQFSATPLPSNFRSSDVGAQRGSSYYAQYPSTGTVTYDPTTGVFTQGAGGYDIWNTNDQFRYTYQTLNGDGSITARVDALDNVGSSTKAGVMIRQSLAANAAHAYIGLNPSGNIDAIQRLTAGANSTNNNGGGQGPWVRLTRVGNTITYARSADGVTWTNTGTSTIAMNGPVLIGLASCAWNSRSEALATFSNVSVTGNVTPPPVTTNGLPAPADLVATPAPRANTSVELSWTAVAGATAYLVERSVDGVNFTTLATVNSGETRFTDANPYGSMRWYYRVSAADGSGSNSTPSTVVSVVNKPNAPALTTFTAGVITVSPTTLYFNFMDVQGEKGYRVDASTDGGDNYTTLLTLAANQTSFNLNGLTAGASYVIRITPLTDIGDGVAPSLVIGTETQLPVVSNLQIASRASGRMVITWDSQTLATSYVVERSLDGTNWNNVATVTDPTWTDTNVTAGNEYYYRITSYNRTRAGLTGAAVFAAAPADVPSPWQSTDVGAVYGGGAALNTRDGAWRLVSGGQDVFGSTDAFQFAYQTKTGNAIIVARVDSVERTDSAAKAGLMIRQSADPDSPFVSIMINAGGGFGIDLRSRTSPGAFTTYQQLLANVTAPYWLKLSRSGDTITAAYSVDGISFISVGSVQLTLPESFEVGMAVASASRTQLNTSTFSNVAITVAPTLVTRPTSQTVQAGQTVSFTATATGTPDPTVQWQVSTNGGLTYTDVSGATSTTYSFVAAESDNGKRFRAVFTNAAGSVRTGSVRLTVTPPTPTTPPTTVPTITANPQDQSVTAGQTASFTAAASGTPAPTVQWQVSANGGQTYTVIDGATSTTYSFVTTTNDNGKRFRAVFLNSAGFAVSNVVQVVVVTPTPDPTPTPPPTPVDPTPTPPPTPTNPTPTNPTPVDPTPTPAPTLAAPVVVTGPASRQATSGEQVSMAVGLGGGPAATIQWQVSSDGGVTYRDIDGATSSTYTRVVRTDDDGDRYRAVVSNAAGSVVSAPAALRVARASVAVAGVAWGQSGRTSLAAADGVYLLPGNLKTDLPWHAIDRLTIRFNAPVPLSAADVSVLGVRRANYGPLTVTPVPAAGDPAGSASEYVITLARAIRAADRVTVVLGNAEVVTYSRRLDVLPGDVNGDGKVNQRDVNLAQSMMGRNPKLSPATTADVDGRPGVQSRDLRLIQQRFGTRLPALAVKPRRAGAATQGAAKKPGGGA